MTVKNMNVGGAEVSQVVAYGKHVVTGQPLLAEAVGTGTSQTLRLLHGLGAGDWNQCLAFYHNGTLLDPAKVRFYPNGRTGPDPYFPGAINYFGLTHVSYEGLPGVGTIAEPLPGLGIFECRKVNEYDTNGNVTGYTYSTSPARIAADLILRVNRLPGSRIDWPSWCLWRDFCAQSITWTEEVRQSDGTKMTVSRTTPRYEAHVVFSQPTSLADALDVVCTNTNSFYQDDGNKIKFFAFEQLTSPVTTITPDQIVKGSFEFTRRDRRQQPNKLLATPLNFFDPYLKEFDPPVIAERPALQDVLARVVRGSAPTLFTCNRNQAGRVLDFSLRFSTDFDTYPKFSVRGDLVHLLSGDLVWLTHPIGGWVNHPFLIIESADDLESGADTRALTLQEFIL